MEEAIIDQLSGKNGHYLHNTTLYFEVQRSLVCVPESFHDYATTIVWQSYDRVLIACTSTFSYPPMDTIVITMDIGSILSSKIKDERTDH